MSKERLTAFTDAILAIIMTILVLELERPEAPTFEAIWALRADFLAYVVSFFWLGAMWVNIHNQWQAVERVNNKIVWWSIVMLFFSSLIPYVTDFVGENFHSLFAQLMYSIVVILVSFSNMALAGAVEKENRISDRLTYNDTLVVGLDLGVKALGILIAVFFYPPAAIIGVMLAGLVVTFGSRFIAKKNENTLGE